MKKLSIFLFIALFSANAYSQKDVSLDVLLDSMGQSVQTVKAADSGIKNIKSNCRSTESETDKKQENVIITTFRSMVEMLGVLS